MRIVFTDATDGELPRCSALPMYHFLRHALNIALQNDTMPQPDPTAPSYPAGSPKLHNHSIRYALKMGRLGKLKYTGSGKNLYGALNYGYAMVERIAATNACMAGAAGQPPSRH